ncbi:DUF4350 domain-containing protein [Puia dinghuensis]|uniref:DUF4350 domain-containing protein n=1 Tax=Puia dinghuensis TaxID=1792502 RepID=A0A8J2U9P2_9BACT|nr:hypothetical protein [Puia dinghuensis]GGA87974.1 hypothetical protein GCM10011511_08880 [Puia dinghuensis]
MNVKRGCIAGLLLVVLFASCTGGNEKKLNRRVSLRRNDRNPYGASIAYEGLTSMFPDADISVSSANPQALSGGEGKKALICIGTRVEATASEVATLMNFVSDGNLVFISAMGMSDTLLHALGIRTSYAFRFRMARTDDMDSLTVGVYSPVNTGYTTFTYPGDGYASYITTLDSQYTSILGRDGSGHPNFVRITYKGGGAIYLHFAPLAFSNFFLLHKQNIGYYENALSYMSPSVKQVFWDDYFRYDHGRSFSAFQYILGNVALRWGFWLLLLLFVLIYAFDSKRRQRMIPVINPLRNTSLDFVRTIGRLYFQRRDNRNLATKMAVHFMDQVRTRYHLPVPALDEELVKRLSYRTGYPKEQLQWLVDYMQQLPARGAIPDEELLHFHQQLEAFYKHT